MSLKILGRIGATLKTITGYPEEPVSRREFISFAARNTLLGAGVGTLLWNHVDKPRDTGLVGGPLNQNELLRQQTLGILRAEQASRTMSPRYHVFIDKVTELIEKREIKFATSGGLHSGYRDENAVYDPDTQTIIADMPDVSSYDDVEFNGLFVHELFHAYQHWLGTPGKKSRLEAEAYLVEGEYLYHNNYRMPDAWLALVAEGKIAGAPIKLNVPVSLLTGAMNVPFDSSQYRDVVKAVGENYIWNDFITVFAQPSTGTAILTARLSKENPSTAELKVAWDEICVILRKQSWSAFHLSPNQRALFDTLFVLRDFYSRRLWESGKMAELEVMINENFETFKSALRLTDFSKRDALITFPSWRN